MRAMTIVQLRLRALLGSEHGRKKALADWCHHAPAWVTNILNGNRMVGLDDLDKIADFFGITVAQLFDPEGYRLRFPDRRTNKERRHQQDRRVLQDRRKVVPYVDIMKYRIPDR